MKILVLSLYYPYPLDQGSNIRVFNLLKQLSGHHDVDLITYAHGDEASPSGLEQLRRYCGAVTVVPVTARAHGRVARAAALLSPRPRSVVLGHDPAMEGIITAALRRARYDVVLVEWLWLASYVATPRAVPCVLDDHNAEAAMFERRMRLADEGLVARSRHWLTLFKLRRYERDALRRFDEVTAVSDIDRARLIALGGSAHRITTVPNGVDVGAISFQGRSDTPSPGRLVYPGSLTYTPNLDACAFFAERILPLVRAQRPATTLAITGKKPAVLPPALRADGVELLGYVDDVRSVVGDSAAMVVPLRQGGGTRLKILEAMALGTPVVSTTVGAEGINVTNGEDILLADDPSDFARRVVALLDDPALGARLARAARGLVEREYDWTSIGARMEAVLSRTAASGARAARRRP